MKPRKGYIQHEDLLQLQKVKDYVYREYDLDKLRRNCVETKLKNCMDFHDTNVEYSIQNIKRWKKEQEQLTAIKSSVQIFPEKTKAPKSPQLLQQSTIKGGLPQMLMGNDSGYKTKYLQSGQSQPNSPRINELFDTSANNILMDQLMSFQSISLNNLQNLNESNLPQIQDFRSFSAIKDDKSMLSMKWSFPVHLENQNNYNKLNIKKQATINNFNINSQDFENDFNSRQNTAIKLKPINNYRIKSEQTSPPQMSSFSIRLNLNTAFGLNSRYEMSEDNKLIVLDDKKIYPIQHQKIRMPVSSSLKKAKRRHINLSPFAEDNSPDVQNF